MASKQHVAARHDMYPSAASALIALLHASLERIVVLDQLASHAGQDRQARTLTVILASTVSEATAGVWQCLHVSATSTSGCKVNDGGCVLQCPDEFVLAEGYPPHVSLTGPFSSTADVHALHANAVSHNACSACLRRSVTLPCTA